MLTSDRPPVILAKTNLRQNKACVSNGGIVSERTFGSKFKMRTPFIKPKSNNRKDFILKYFVSALPNDWLPMILAETDLRCLPAQNNACLSNGDIISVLTFSWKYKMRRILFLKPKNNTQTFYSAVFDVSLPLGQCMDKHWNSLLIMCLWTNQISMRLIQWRFYVRAAQAPQIFGHSSSATGWINWFYSKFCLAVVASQMMRGQAPQIFFPRTATRLIASNVWSKPSTWLFSLFQWVLVVLIL